MTLILASSSPRRSALLQAAGFEFEVRVADVDETPLVGETAEALVRRLAQLKARAIASARHEVVLAADTTVA
jgi:septum formation protein